MYSLLEWRAVQATKYSEAILTVSSNNTDTTNNMKMRG